MPDNRHDVAFASPSAAIRLDHLGHAKTGSPGSKNERIATMSKTPASPQQGSTPAPAQQQEQGTTTPPQQPGQIQSGQTPPVIRDWASI